MQIPPEIAFHNLDVSPSAEAEILEHVAKLDRLFDRLVTVRVRIEAPHNHQRNGKSFRAHIEMSVPGKDLLVTHEPSPDSRGAAHTPTLQTVIRQSFKTAERQLIEYKRQLSGEVKTHEMEFLGQISQLYPSEDHGFVLTNTGTQLYFHRNAVLNEDFERLETGEAVHYLERMGDTGPIAYKVWRRSPGDASTTAGHSRKG